MAIGFEAFMFSQSRRKFTNKCFSTEREHINASHHLACHSVRVSAMAKKLSLQEVLDHITVWVRFPGNTHTDKKMYSLNL